MLTPSLSMKSVQGKRLRSSGNFHGWRTRNPRALNSWFQRRQTQIAAWKIRRLQPVCQDGKFKRREAAGRLARERQLIRRGLRDFGHGTAERRANAIKPLERGGFRSELFVSCNH